MTKGFSGAAARSGFSLVELSIVLVILGLLTGGILTGQNLIRAAELRGLVTEFQKYQTAIQTFRSKYFALPGDMTNATDFWGAISSGTCPAGTGSGTETCNGNGDGRIQYAGASEYGEAFMFWQHLANAGMIEGSYSGIAGSAGSGAQHIAGINHPKSKMPNFGWAVFNFGMLSGHPYQFDGAYDGTMWVGEPTTSVSPRSGPIYATEVWNIDKKLDDGLPARGRLVLGNRISCARSSDNATVLTSSAAHAALTDAVYNISDDPKSCGLMIRNLF